LIYLDNAATSWPKPQKVYDAVLEYMKKWGANPGRSGHTMARNAADVVFETRNLLCELFNADDPNRIVFTCNATEALNTAIKGLLKPNDHVITSCVEHNSVLRPLKKLRGKGVKTTFIDVNDEGIIDIEDIKKNIQENTRMVILTHASNVLGSIQPIKQVGELCREKGIVFLVDASQTAGVYPIDVKELNIDLLAFPGHKGLLGPQGTGGLYVGEGIDLDSLKEGGTGSLSERDTQPDFLPDRLESGTLNTPGIAGLGAGIKFILETGIEKIRKHEMELTQYFLHGLQNMEGVKVYGPRDPSKQVAVVSINVKDVHSNEVSRILDGAFNIATRPGFHCAPLTHRSMGSLKQGMVRFSFGYFNTRDEIDAAIDALKAIQKEF